MEHRVWKEKWNFVCSLVSFTNIIYHKSPWQKIINKPKSTGNLVVFYLKSILPSFILKIQILDSINFSMPVTHFLNLPKSRWVGILYSSNNVHRFNQNPIPMAYNLNKFARLVRSPCPKLYVNLLNILPSPLLFLPLTLNIC